MKLRRKNEDQPAVATEAALSVEALAEEMKGKFGIKKELRKLPELLAPDERVVQLARGIYQKNIGLVAATDRRVIFIEQSLTHSQQEDFLYTRISSVQTEKSFGHGGKLTIYASGNTAVIEGMFPKDAAREFGDLIRRHIGAGTAAPSPAAAPATSDPLDRLRQLQEMQTAGLVSDSEFETKRTEILSAL